MFLSHPLVKLSSVGSLRDREVACTVSNLQGLNFESCVWRAVSSYSSHHPQKVLLAQFVHVCAQKCPKARLIHFIYYVEFIIQLFAQIYHSFAEIRIRGYYVRIRITANKNSSTNGKNLSHISLMWPFTYTRTQIRTLLHLFGSHHEGLILISCATPQISMNDVIISAQMRKNSITYWLEQLGILFLYFRSYRFFYVILE